MSTTVTAPAPPLAQRTARRQPTLLDAIAWECSKLAAQARARWTLLICLIAPIAIVLIINAQQRPPKQPLRPLHPSERLRGRAADPRLRGAVDTALADGPGGR